MLPVLSLTLSILSWCSHDITPYDALLVVNMQNDFMESVMINHDSLPEYPIPDDQIIQINGRNYTKPGALAINHTIEIVEPINTLMHVFEEHGAPVVLSMNWHPENHCSFCRDGDKPVHKICGPFGRRSHGHFNISNACHDRVSRMLLKHKKLLQWPDNCVQNEYGARFNPFLEVGENATVVKKAFFHSFDSYSVWNGAITNSSYPFWNETESGNDLIIRPSFRRFIADNQINRLFVVGVPLDFDVRATCMEAMSRFEIHQVVLVTALTPGLTHWTSAKALKKMKKAGVTIIPKHIRTIEDILDAACKEQPRSEHSSEFDDSTTGDGDDNDNARPGSINFDESGMGYDFEGQASMDGGDDGDSYDHRAGHMNRDFHTSLIVVGSVLTASVLVAIVGYGAWRMSRSRERRGSSYEGMI